MPRVGVVNRVQEKVFIVTRVWRIRWRGVGGAHATARASVLLAIRDRCASQESGDVQL